MALNEKSSDQMSFFGHFQELRKHLVRACLAIAIMASMAFIYKDIIFDFIILNPQKGTFVTNRLLCQLSERLSIPALCINQTPIELINTEMAGQFTIHIWISFIAGLILAFPYIIFELWRFVSPALTRKEKDASSLAVFSISMLFFVGVLFSYFLIVPLTISFLSGYQVSASVNNLISLRSYISTLAGVTFATGLVFELPVFVYFLARIGLVTSSLMKKYRKIAFVIILVVAAIITPPDVFSQVMVGLPLYILYEASIYIAKAIEKRRKD